MKSIETMYMIHFNPTGNFVSALYCCAIPLVIIIIGAFARRKGIGKERWLFVQRYWYLPLLIPLFLYYGIIYRWLFFDQFYWLTLKNDGTCQIEYTLPTRIRTITMDDVSSIQAVSGDIWTYRTARILILTKDGKRYSSAQVSESDKDYYIELLKKHKNTMKKVANTTINPTGNKPGLVLH